MARLHQKKSWLVGMPKKKIWACVSFWQDEPELMLRCMKSLRGKVDEIVAADGKFRNYPAAVDQKFWTTNDSLRIAREYATIFIHARPWNDPMQKRNHCLVAKNPWDYYFMIDADEELVGDVRPGLPINGECKTVKILRPDIPDYESYHVRILAHSQYLQYKYKPWMAFIADKEISECKRLENSDFDPPLLKSGHILHHIALRQPERRRSDTAYMLKKEKEPIAEISDKNTVAATGQIKIKNKGEYYLSSTLRLAEDQEAWVPIEEAKRLLADFPGRFEVLGETA